MRYTEEHPLFYTLYKDLHCKELQLGGVPVRGNINLFVYTPHSFTLPVHVPYSSIKPNNRRTNKKTIGLFCMHAYTLVYLSHFKYDEL